MTVEKVSVKNEQEAEALALVILEFILADQVLLDLLLSMSGVTTSQMKSSLTDRNFLIGVLDFLLVNESDVISFCEQRESHLENPKIARQILAGYSDG